MAPFIFQKTFLHNYKDLTQEQESYKIYIFESSKTKLTAIEAVLSIFSLLFL